MTHEQKVINTYTVHYFDRFKDAQTWLRVIQGEDAQFVSSLSNTNLAIWTTEIDNQFDGKQYTVRMILDIIKSRNAKALKNIHPLYFQNLKKSTLEKEEASFLASHLTLKQLEYLPNITFGGFDADDLEILLDTARQKQSLRHNRIYTLKKDDPSEQTIFVLVGDYPIAELLRRKIVYANRYGRKNTAKKALEPVNFNKEWATIEQVASYLGINVQYFFMQKDYNENNAIYKYLGDVEYVDDKKVFQTKKLKELLHAAYRPINPNYKDCEERYLPKDGLRLREELPVEFKVTATVSRKSVTHAIEVGKLSYFDITSRCIRVSKQDFQDYLVDRVEKSRDYSFVSKVMNREVIQFPKQATKEQKEVVMNEYLNEKSFLDLVFLSDKAPWKNPKAYFQNTLWTSLNEHSKLYLNRSDGNLYRRKSELMSWLSEVYQYQGKEDKVSCKHIDFSLMVKHQCEDNDFIGDLCPMNHFEYWAEVKHPNLDAEDLKQKVMYWIKQGYIPVLLFSKRLKYIYLPDLIESKQYQNYLEKHHVEKVRA